MTPNWKVVEQGEKQKGTLVWKTPMGCNVIDI